MDSTVEHTQLGKGEQSSWNKLEQMEALGSSFQKEQFKM